MFVTSDKGRISKLQIYKPGQCIPVYPATSLLADKRHHFVLEQINRLSQLPSEHHEALYVTLVHRFVTWVQVLPLAEDYPLSGLMNDSLIQGINALYQLVTMHPEATPIERYALFSAALLQNVSHVVVNQKIFITNAEGVFIKEWHPFEGPMTEDAEAAYYKIMPLSSFYHRLDHSLTPLLARQLLPSQGFHWIASDLRLFSDWMDALRGEESEGVGRLAHTLQLFQHQKADNLVDTLPLISVTQQESSATVQADSFFEWLKKGIASGDIPVNTPSAGVHVTAAGVFLEKPGIFKQFVDLYDTPANLFSVFQQFGNLFGLTKLSGADYRIDQLFSEYPDISQNKYSSGFAGSLSKTHSIREGVIISDPALIFLNGQVPTPTPYLKSSPSSQNSYTLPALPPLRHNPENKLK